MADALALRVVQTIVGLLGMLGNALVCVVIWRVKTMHTITNAFIFNQAVVDGVASLLLMLIGNIDTSETTLPPGVSGFLLCYLWITRFFLWSSFATSTSNLVALTVERYVAIVFPFRYQGFFGPRLAGLLIAITWLYGFLSSGFNLVWVTYEDGVCIPYVLPEPPVISAFLLLHLNYLVPVSVMCVAYIHIACVLKRSARRVVPASQAVGAHRSTAENANTLDGSLLRARRNTFKTLCVVFVVYVICWTPNAVIFSFFLLGIGNVDLSGAFYVVSVALVTSNSCANPFVYALKYKQFRKGLKEVFGRANARQEDISTVSARVA